MSRTWRKLKGDWDAWNGRDLSREDIVRLILDGTVVRAGGARRWAEGFGFRAQHGRREIGGADCETWSVTALSDSFANYEAAVVGSMILRISVILVAGNPLISACVRITASSLAR